MSDMTWNKRHVAFVPVLWSLLLHGLLILVSFFIFFNTTTEIPKEDMLKFNVKAVDTRPVAESVQGAADPSRFVRAIKLQRKNPLMGLKGPQDVPIQTLIKRETVVPQNSQEVSPKRMEFDDSVSEGGTNLEAILTKTEERQLKEQVESKRQSVSENQGLLKMIEGHKVDFSNLIQSLKKPLEGFNTKVTQNLNVDPEEGMPGFTPTQGSSGHAEARVGLEESGGDISKYESLDDFLDIQVATYQDPADKQKYFVIKILAKKDVKVFHVMPKEILFTIDSSLSISPDRLDEFKKGIRYCLTHLNEGDLFNIVSFKDKATFFSPQSLPANPATIKKAEQFVSALTSSEQTDVYLAFKKIIETSPLTRRPSNIVLLSDGRPTHGVVDSRGLINSITRLNHGVRPIFAFSGGSKVNRYLLDFITYQNRAWSQFIKKTPDIDKGLAEFYDKIRDPIFLNLRYQLNNLNEKEVFPKSLPDFYKNAEFTLYGAYDSEDNFSMQLLGDVEGKTKQLVFTRSLSEAPKGGVDIKMGYAFNKVYHLISQATIEGLTPARSQEIQDLSKRYGVTTPYSPELEKLD